MREIKYVKLKVNMYEDTKFKIIDTMEDRDLIHYIWTRLVTLAGKVNLEGNLYMSKNIPYTVETLSIEFNRSIEKVQLALNVLKDLEMMEVTEDGVYRVKNFAKHQNIKVTEKFKNIDNKQETINVESEEANNKENIIKNIANNNFENEEIRTNENLETPIYKKNSQELKNSGENKTENIAEDNKISNSSESINEEGIKDKNTSRKEGKVIKLSNDKNQKVSKDNENVQVDEHNSKEKLTDNSSNQIVLTKKKRQKSPPKNNKKKGSNIIEVIDEDCLVEFSDGIDLPQGEGYNVIKCFEF